MSYPSLARVSRGFSIAFLALAFTSGFSTVRAQTDVPAWMLADPISDAVKAAEARIASLEAKVASLTSRESAELCVADDAGARTCINKAQLDRLLKMMQAAAIDPPAQVTENVTNSATTPAPAAPTEVAASAPETKPAAADAKASEEPSRIETTNATAIEAPRQTEQAALAPLDEDSMPTGSVPAPAPQGRALVTQPEVEITTPSTDQ